MEKDKDREEDIDREFEDFEVWSSHRTSFVTRQDYTVRTTVSVILTTSYGIANLHDKQNCYL